jgi:hypothetical protein
MPVQSGGLELFMVVDMVDQLFLLSDSGGFGFTSDARVAKLGCKGGLRERWSTKWRPSP